MGKRVVEFGKKLMFGKQIIIENTNAQSHQKPKEPHIPPPMPKTVDDKTDATADWMVEVADSIIPEIRGLERKNPQAHKDRQEQIKLAASNIAKYYAKSPEAQLARKMAAYIMNSPIPEGWNIKQIQRLAAEYAAEKEFVEEAMIKIEEWRQKLKRENGGE